MVLFCSARFAKRATAGRDPSEKGDGDTGLEQHARGHPRAHPPTGGLPNLPRSCVGDLQTVPSCHRRRCLPPTHPHSPRATRRRLVQQPTSVPDFIPALRVRAATHHHCRQLPLSQVVHVQGGVLQVDGEGQPWRPYSS
jgi:hypothetical protein